MSIVEYFAGMKRNWTIDYDIDYYFISLGFDYGIVNYSRMSEFGNQFL